MALTTDQKKAMLQQLLDSVDSDLYRQQLEADAYQAELDVVTDDNQKAATQANLDNINATIARLQARQSTWQSALTALG